MDKAMTASSQDWDAKAAELLPCNGFDCMLEDQRHEGYCQVHRRPAVAAALREAYQQGQEDMKQSYIDTFSFLKGLE